MVNKGLDKALKVGIGLGIVVVGVSVAMGGIVVNGIPTVGHTFLGWYIGISGAITIFNDFSN